MKKIFIGGWPGSGSRVTQKILQQTGYYIGSVYNLSLDFFGIDFRDLFQQFYFDGKTKPMKEVLEEDLQGRESWSLKHSYFMWIVPLLKEWFPDSQFMLTVRNPIDNLTNRYKFHAMYGGLKNKCNVQDKLNFYGDVMEQALPHTDLVVRLEDLCFDTNNTISRLLEFAEVDDRAENYADIIKVPKSIGRGKKFYGYVYHPCLESLGYRPKRFSTPIL
jgi:hypothetical protein